MKWLETLKADKNNTASSQFIRFKVIPSYIGFQISRNQKSSLKWQWWHSLKISNTRWPYITLHYKIPISGEKPHWYFVIKKYWVWKFDKLIVFFFKKNRGRLFASLNKWQQCTCNKKFLNKLFSTKVWNSCI